MVLRDVDRLEGMLNSETDRPNKKNNITECAKLQAERWGGQRLQLEIENWKLEIGSAEWKTGGPTGQGSEYRVQGSGCRVRGECSVEFGMRSAEWKR